MIKKRILYDKENSPRKVQYEGGLNKKIGDQYTYKDANEVKEVINHNVDYLEATKSELSQNIENLNAKVDETKTDLEQQVDETKTDLEQQIDETKTDLEQQITESTVKEDKPLIVPTFTKTQWTLYNASEQDISSSASEHGITSLTSKDIIVENGYKLKLTASYKYNVTSENNKPPTAVGSSSDFKSSLPENNVSSQEETFAIIANNKSYKAEIISPKLGLEVVNNKVVYAKGNDATSCIANAYFRHRLYYGKGQNELDDISTLTRNELVTSRVKTISGITCAEGEYYYYCYPSSLGELTSIKQNGSYDVTGAFISSRINFTNKAGKSIEYLIYKSKNSGAFTNVSLSFS